jgi:hypothetical protein
MVTQLGWEPLQVRRVKIRLLLKKGVSVDILPG